MVLADTSVWVHHFRFGEPGLRNLLAEGLVLMHPFVLGELACGNLRNRSATLSDMQALPLATTASHAEARRLLEEHHMWGRGLGWVDIHLLASAALSRSQFWTLDKRLATEARRLGLG